MRKILTCNAVYEFQSLKLKTMRTIILLLIIIPEFAVAQTQDVYIRMDYIRGDVRAEGYVGCVQALTINSYGNNSGQFDFTMNISSAAAGLKRAMTQSLILRNAKVSVLTGAPRIVLNEINMEDVKVLKCTESMGNNGVMTLSVTLSAEHIEWVYYTIGPNGAVTGVTKTVYNAPVNPVYNEPVKIQRERRR